MIKKMFLGVIALSIVFTSCSDDDTIALSAGEISGGPFTFSIDGVPDMVSGISLDGNQFGSESTWVVTDDSTDPVILGLPPTLSALEAVDFEGAGGGNCLIWYLRHDGSLSGASLNNNVSQLAGNFDLSNSISVTRLSGGTITGGPFTFIVDGTPDMVSGISVDGTPFGSQRSWVVTDNSADPVILGLPPTLAALEGVDFDGAGGGECLIWYLSHDGSLGGAAVNNNVSQLTGNYSLSNSILVSRIDAGMISGGPFTFSVNGMPDMVSGISLDGSQFGNQSSWVVTDDSADPVILGLPPTLAALEGVDFDGAGGGNCLIWYLRHDGSLSGAAVNNSVSQLTGNFDLSNSITVTRLSGGTISGGPFTFAVDGTPDMVSGISVGGTPFGSQSSWVVTDNSSDPVILGLPPTLAALEGVDFDGAGGGECLIWYLSHDGSLGGAAVNNNVSQLTGNYSLSNSISVVRLDAGMITGGPFNFNVDGTPDMVSGIALDGTQFGSQSSWVVTDNSADPVILSLPPTLAALEGVDFDGAGTGTCLIWYLRHDGSLSGAAVNNTVSQLGGNFDLSNAITVNRN